MSCLGSKARSKSSLLRWESDGSPCCRAGREVEEATACRERELPAHLAVQLLAPPAEVRQVPPAAPDMRRDARGRRVARERVRIIESPLPAMQASPTKPAGARARRAAPPTRIRGGRGARTCRAGAPRAGSRRWRRSSRRRRRLRAAHLGPAREPHHLGERLHDERRNAEARGRRRRPVFVLEEASSASSHAIAFVRVPRAASPSRG